MCRLWLWSATLLAAWLHVSCTLQPSTSAGVSGVASLSWTPRRIHGGVLRDPRTHVHKRAIAALKPNVPHQPCITPSGALGRCRHLQYCILQDFRTNFPRLLDYMCIIEKSFVGVCCPERPEMGGVLPPSSLAGLLPSIADASPPGAGEPPGPQLGEGFKPKIRGCGRGARASTAPSAEGGQADRGEWPWMVALLKDDDLQFCGGVLITDRHVLTASHCLVNVEASELLVRLGEYDLENPNETRSRDFVVSEIRRHERFQKATYENDIAILKLRRPAVFNSYIWPVCLPPPDDNNYENVTAVVAGWGTLGFGEPPSDVLMEVSVPVWPQERCKPMYAQPILDNMMCAGGYEGGRDACQGDSGGPLLLQMADGSWSTIGVVSWGIRCGEATHPGVYIRVNHFLPWILKNSDF